MSGVPLGSRSSLLAASRSWPKFQIPVRSLQSAVRSPFAHTVGFLVLGRGMRRATRGRGQTAIPCTCHAPPRPLRALPRVLRIAPRGSWRFGAADCALLTCASWCTICCMLQLQHTPRCACRPLNKRNPRRKVGGERAFLLLSFFALCCLCAALCGCGCAAAAQHPPSSPLISLYSADSWANTSGEDWTRVISVYHAHALSTRVSNMGDLSVPWVISVYHG
jgi:hypothetical protein